MPYSSEHHDVNQVLEETRYTLDAALSPTRVLLAVHVKGEPDADGLSTFISDAGTEQDENALRVEAIYRSSRDAVLFLVTAPLAVWQLLPDHGGCQFVSLMMGGNLWSASSKAGAEQKRSKILHFVLDTVSESIVSCGSGDFQFQNQTGGHPSHQSSTPRDTTQRAVANSAPTTIQPTRCPGHGLEGEF